MSGVYCPSNYVKYYGLKITGGYYGLTTGNGYAIIDGCYLSGMGHTAIGVTNNGTVKNCTVLNCQYYGINGNTGLYQNNYVANCGTWGIKNLYGDVFGNLVVNASIGIYTSRLSVASKNVISGCNTGFRVELFAANIFDNVVYNCGTGVAGSSLGKFHSYRNLLSQCGVAYDPSVVDFIEASDTITDEDPFVDAANGDYSSKLRAAGINTPVKVGSSITEMQSTSYITAGLTPQIPAATDPDTIIEGAYNSDGLEGNYHVTLENEVKEGTAFGVDQSQTGTLTQPKIVDMDVNREPGSSVFVTIENASESGDTFQIINEGTEDAVSCAISERTAQGFTVALPLSIATGVSVAKYTRADGETSYYGYTVYQQRPNITSVTNESGARVVDVSPGTALQIVVEGLYTGGGDSLQLIPSTGDSVVLTFEKQADRVLTAIPVSSQFAVYEVRYTDKNGISDSCGLKVSAPDAPTIEGFSVSEGSVSGGTLVTVYVRNFGAAPGQVFLNDAAQHLVKYSDREVIYRTLAHAAGAVALSITTGAGDVISSPVGFTYVDYSQGVLNEPLRGYVPHTLIRKEPGQYVGGLFESGPSRQYTLHGLPLQQIRPLERQVLPENQRTLEGYTLYTSVPLTPVDVTNQRAGDALLVDGKEFDVVTCYKKQAGRLNHYKVQLLRGE
jgi:hypothetical protein